MQVEIRNRSIPPKERRRQNINTTTIATTFACNNQRKCFPFAEPRALLK